MRSSLGSRIATVHASFVTLLAAAGAFVFLLAAERALDEEMSARTRTVARMAAGGFDAAWVPGLAGGSAPLRELAESRLRLAAASADAHRITVVDGAGAVLASSDARLVAGRQHPGLAVDAAEVRRARSEGEAVSSPYRLDDGVWYQSAWMRLGDDSPALLGAELAVTWRAPLQRLRLAVGVFAAAGVLAVAALGFVTARGITRRLGRLAAAMDSAGPEGLPRPAGVEGDDEVGRLGRRFDALVDAIRRHDLELRAMSATVAHEVRNPLGAMSGFAELLARRHPDEDTRRLTAGIRDEIDALERLVARFLRYAGEVRIEHRSVDVGDLVDDALRGAIPPEAPVRVTRTVPEDLPPVSGDPDALREVLVNLVRNAAQAAGPTGSIAVSAESADAAVVMRVRDDGPGIPEEIRARLFEPFATTKADGTGLGLAICRKIVAAHQGALDVETGSAGTTFRIRLPMAAAGSSAAKVQRT